MKRENILKLFGMWAWIKQYSMKDHRSPEDSKQSPFKWGVSIPAAVKKSRFFKCYKEVIWKNSKESLWLCQIVLCSEHLESLKRHLLSSGNQRLEPRTTGSGQLRTAFPSLRGDSGGKSADCRLFISPWHKLLSGSFKTAFKDILKWRDKVRFFFFRLDYASTLPY